MAKKALCFGLIIMLVLLCADAFAGGAGNCVKPIKTTSKYFGIGGAFEYNYVDKRMHKLDNPRGAAQEMKLEHISQIYGKGIIGLGKYVNIYGKIGSSNYDMEFVAAASQAKMVIDLNDGVYTGAGINALFPITDVGKASFGIGFDIQGNAAYNTVSSIERQGVKAWSAGGAFYSLDGQNSLYLTCAYPIDFIQTIIIPYVGGYHSWAVVGTDRPGLTYETIATGYVKKNYQAAYDFLSFGPVVGVDVDIAKFVSLNVEGRFVGETAITTGATVKF